MEQDIETRVHNIPWAEVLAVILAACAASLSIGAAVEVYISQASTASSHMWPLPGLILLYWVLLEAIELVVIVLAARQKPFEIMYVGWAVNGAFIPLIILGALSIGWLVFVGCVVFLISSSLLSIQHRVKLFTSLGSFMLGAIASAWVLLPLIIVGNLQYYTFLSRLLTNT